LVRERPLSGVRSQLFELTGVVYCRVGDRTFAADEVFRLVGSIGPPRGSTVCHLPMPS
jgi:hypothetical protein